MTGADNTVMNLSISTLMASDNTDHIYEKPHGFRVPTSPKSREGFDRIHDAQAPDAQSVEMSPGRDLLAERFAMFADRYGTHGC